MSLPSMPSPAETVGRLVTLLDLEPIEENIFRGRSPQDARQRVFGGQVAGQALVAAGRTVAAGLTVHSLHAYFIRGGDPSVPLVYMVDRVRDGRSFSVRRVMVVQHGQVIFTMSASFQLEQAGLEYASTMPDGIAAPETLPTLAERVVPFPDVARLMTMNRPFDLRYASTTAWEQRAQGSGTDEPMRLWMKAVALLPDDPLVHAAVLTFATDLTLIDTVLRQQGLDFFSDPIASASLDHAMWFHRPFRADEWFLYESESISASGSRGLASGKIFTADGRHIVTVMQEGLIRR